ncbi:endonuclease [Mycolicibacterium sp. 018/SC-01/001]|uniref:endonuclease n=1 Tax=Mycolicibacterium sp. 018/SC-01/001 TaxID=2592069 RepID=UPI00117C60C6|nr:endonuclease [Mycolicibacterium sp. 018/SC-01/001]TRW82414.1 endonuclease [Mycolicibacterium sp. 018/SC-01/001]
MRTNQRQKDTVRRLLSDAGETFATQAGITLADKPMPLFELLVLCMLASKPIEANIATRAAAELFSEKLRTPDAVLSATRRTVIDAFGRAGYARYDESSATRLTQIATAVKENYHGDLRGLAERAAGDVAAATDLLEEFTGIGDTGAGIFLREVQDVWTWVRPYFDRRALDAAKDLGLPDDADELGSLAGDACAPLAAALVRVSLNRALRDAVLS